MIDCRSERVDFYMEVFSDMGALVIWKTLK